MARQRKHSISFLNKLIVALNNGEDSAVLAANNGLTTKELITALYSCGVKMGDFKKGQVKPVSENNFKKRKGYSIELLNILISGLNDGRDRKELAEENGLTTKQVTSALYNCGIRISDFDKGEVQELPPLKHDEKKSDINPMGKLCDEFVPFVNLHNLRWDKELACRIRYHEKSSD